VRNLQAAGLGGLIGEPPALSALAWQARHCWIFCGGWNPALLPLYAALHPQGSSDWHGVMDRMLVIRAEVAKP